MSAQGFNEGRGKPFSEADIRFTTKGHELYAIELGWPTNTVTIKSLGKFAQSPALAIKEVQLLGSQERIRWSQNEEALAIEAPTNKPCDHAFVFRITMEN